MDKIPFPRDRWSANSSKPGAIYHLIQKDLWDKVKADGGEYLPPTYSKDDVGYGPMIHATAVKDALLSVANHFYTAVEGDWYCLELDCAKLEASERQVWWEPPTAVGNIEAYKSEDIDLFPHIYGGGLVTSHVVKELAVERDADGKFVGIGS
mmetsp:Transcript_3097/g.5124  ORF Transcript_3097/g.5124 Transcript_3097/m.5124 type:complete len:152 (+) Transcript_3097:36-491(+)|eukprot:CAMPEP_0169112584 /NCGR_PEP_ID=MMETSP1015-20121227/27720_1 /TAXON_ID=342587 /ORGANISM="Karlodinium micrum, Strain CCMP2283" /LENGTH=151 /DNA_ID=CAMNT_0009174645 /DNA_START=36 /DNA_END=491 /DNA_ORIENTATION=+